MAYVEVVKPSRKRKWRLSVRLWGPFLDASRSVDMAQGVGTIFQGKKGSAGLTLTGG